MKYEDIYSKHYETPRAVERGLGEYFPFYNDERFHQSLNYRTPAEVYLDKTNSTSTKRKNC